MGCQILLFISWKKKTFWKGSKWYHSSFVIIILCGLSYSHRIKIIIKT